jgi:nucleoside-diphosphate-sugar epimerase
MDSDTDLACDAAIHMYVMNGPEAEAFVDAFGQRADRLLVISSGDVYRAYGVLHRKEHAAVDPDPLTEEAPLRSVLHLYAEFPEYDKIPVEREVMQAGGSNCVLRLPAVYGPNDSHHRAGAWLKQMNSDQPFTLGESFANWRWTHGYIEDVAEAIALAAMDARSAGRIYNVGEAVTPTMFERIEGLGRAFGWRGKIAVTSDEASPLDYRQPMVMDSSRIRNELGFGELATAEDALQRTIAWEVESGYAQRPP